MTKLNTFQGLALASNIPNSMTFHVFLGSQESLTRTGYSTILYFIDNTSRHAYQFQHLNTDLHCLVNYSFNCESDRGANVIQIMYMWFREPLWTNFNIILILMRNMFAGEWQLPWHLHVSIGDVAPGLTERFKLNEKPNDQMLSI